MPSSTWLVIYYSRTGTTAKLANAIASATSADVERLTDTVNREGPIGFLRSLRDAIRRTGSILQPIGVDPSAYELVIIGTPDWGQSVAAPVRTFLQTHHGKLPRVAFFLTDGLTDHAKVFADMSTLVGSTPVAVLGIPHDEVANDRYADQVKAFVKSLPAVEPAPVEARF